MSSCNTIFTMKTNGIPSLGFRILIILACFATNNIATESDISCLRSIKESLQDPFHVLFTTWNFDNITEDFICRFAGVDCWSTDGRVMNLRLQEMGLIGSFPVGIKNCTSMLMLNLSSNNLSGSIPSNIGDFVPYIASLDLSNNNLTGPIPPSIADCSYINYLRLDNNHLTGQIPPKLSQCSRIKVFSVANNRLTGHVPMFPNVNFYAESYENNLGLCGGPLNACQDEDEDDDYQFFSDIFFVSGFLTGFPFFTFLSMLFMFSCWPKVCMISNMRSCYHLLIKKIKGRKHHLIQRIPQILFAKEIINQERKVVVMEKFIRRLSLVELEMATNDFDDKNVIGNGSTGVMYKARFTNSVLLAIKKLHRFKSLEKYFLTEFEILGRLRHTNLVPLLGFCFEMEKKFLAYKYMCNGTLHHWLHYVEGKKMGWTLRLKIAVGIARGLAWLHHNNVLRVVHLKINSKCILLDENFEPKISNFGDAMILMNASTGTQPSSGCHIAVPNSSPYKEDVFGFGILLVELITGRIPPSTNIDSLIDHVIVIDECLMRQGFNEEIQKTVRIAENCIHPHREDATSMLQVYQEMRSIGISRNEISITSR